MIQYREATRDDNQQLLALTASSSMKGEMVLRIDRNPNFFTLLELRGDGKTYVAVENNIIVGSISVSFQQVYINGQVFPMKYVGDFKVAETHRNQGIGLELCDAVAAYILSIDADLVFLNHVKGNVQTFSFFKNRPNVPNFQNIGTFKIHQLVGKKSSSRNTKYTIKQAQPSENIIRFLNNYYCQYELANLITMASVNNCSIFSVTENESVIAVMCLVDTMHLKQNMVLRLSWSMKLMIKITNLIGGVLELSKLPVEKQPIRMMYIKYIAVQNNDQQLFSYLFQLARNIVFEKKYSFVSIGLHEKDPINSMVSGIFKFTFNSVGMFLSVKNNQQIFDHVKNGIPFEDYSLV